MHWAEKFRLFEVAVVVHVNVPRVTYGHLRVVFYGDRYKSIDLLNCLCQMPFLAVVSGHNFAKDDWHFRIGFLECDNYGVDVVCHILRLGPQADVIGADQQHHCLRLEINNIFV